MEDNQDPKPAIEGYMASGSEHMDSDNIHMNEQYMDVINNMNELYMNSDKEVERRGTKRPNTGTAIESGNESRDNKKAKKYEANFENLKALLNEPLRIKFQEFNEKTDRLKYKKIEGLEAKIFALLHEDEDKEFKNDNAEPKKCFLEWLNHLDGSDDDRKTLNHLKNRAFSDGINLSRAIAHVMFFMSIENYNEMLEKFGVLGNSLEWINQDGRNSVVIVRVLEILGTTKAELRNKKEHEMLEIPSNGKELEFVDGIISGLLEEIFRLELFWMHRGLPNSKDSLMGAIPSLEDDLDNSELQLIDIVSVILKSTEKLSVGLDADEVKQSAEHQRVDAKINQLWQNL